MKPMKNGELDVIIPITLKTEPAQFDSMIESILEQNRLYGFTQFLLTGPSKAWRAKGFPPMEHYGELAKAYVRAVEILEPQGIRCGWWNILTVKSGPSPDFSRMVRADGSETPMASCPMDPAFQQRLAESAALFARIAKPEFIIVEDDYSVHAAAAGYGCFCEHHLKAFAQRQGRYYTREELVAIFESGTPEGYALLRQWRGLARDSLVALSEAMRRAVDRENPEIPIGYMQSGSCDHDGDCTEAVCKALAGPDHTPFSRIYGTFYCGAEGRAIPRVLYHALHSRQRIKGDFRFYHESDSYPHTRFYSAGGHMRTIMGTAYSYGFDGSTFQTRQSLDDPNEETAFGAMFARERPRFNQVHRIAKQCRIKGVQIDYDPFWNTADRSGSRPEPLWADCISLFGIPYTTEASKVAFWDWRQAKYADDATVRRCLSGCLFLDGDAAKCLVERGYGEYLGVALGEDAIQGMLLFDLGGKEVVCPDFATPGKGRYMPLANCYADKAGNGILRHMTVTDPACRVVTEARTGAGTVICPAMTCFDNSLGGRVIVMAMTLEGNGSQSLFNYRRQRLLQKLIADYADEYVFAKEAPDLFVVMNEPEKAADFKGMLTLTNLCEDPLESVGLHLPPAWKEMTRFLRLNQDGSWDELSYSRTEDGILIRQKLEHLTPMYILGA